MTHGIQRLNSLPYSLLSVDLDLMGEIASHSQISLNAVVSPKHCSYSSLFFSLTSFRRFAVWKPTTVTTLQRTPSKRFCKDHTQTIMQQLKQPLKQTYIYTPGLNNKIFFPYWLSRAISCGPTTKEYIEKYINTKIEIFVFFSIKI